MGVITPAVGVPKGDTWASKLARARPRRLSGSQKIARIVWLLDCPCENALADPARAETGAHERTTGFSEPAGTGCAPACTSTGFEVMQLLATVLVPEPPP